MFFDYGDGRCSLLCQFVILWESGCAGPFAFVGGVLGSGAWFRCLVAVDESLDVVCTVGGMAYGAVAAGRRVAGYR